MADPELCRAAAQWLDDSVGSHTIYGVDKLTELPAGVTYDARSDQLVYGDRRQPLGSRTVAQVEEFESQKVAGPKGAEPFAPEVSKQERVFGGYELSYRLSRLLTGTEPPAKMGRGFAHRAAIEHLREAA